MAVLYQGNVAIVKLDGNKVIKQYNSGVGVIIQQENVIAIAKLSHPALVETKVLVRDPLKLEMEYCKKGPLTTEVHEDTFARYVIQIAEGLNFLHTKGYVHCVS